MNGKGNVRFSELFKDTLSIHGYLFALEHYVMKNNMSQFEFKFWLKASQI